MNSHRRSRRRRVGGSLVLLIILLPSTNSAGIFGQETSPPLSPTESYKAAMAPFTATRNQPGDLTDADKVALGMGMTRASHDCVALSADVSRFAETELFALGQLCIFGQQFEAARVDLVRYLVQPQPTQREQALVLLVRAFIGLNAPDSAEPQIESLLHDYPYDASIHLAIDSVIDNAEASIVASHFNNIALKLCQTQTAATLPILTSGKALEGKDSSISAAKLFTDAIRCASLAQSSGEPGNLKQLDAILQQPDWVGTADLKVMQLAFLRQRMVGQQVPLHSTLYGHLLATNSLTPRTVSLARGTVLLVPFTLCSPSTPEVLGNLARLAPHQSIYAITSWNANNGSGDTPSPQTLDGLRSWQRGLPRQVIMIVVPDTDLEFLAADTFPAGVLVRNGKIVMNSPLSGSGEQRLLLKLLTEQTGPRVAHPR